MNYSILTKKKQLLDQYKPLEVSLENNLNNWFHIELTYTSNGLEGNTLTRQETVLVVEKGLSVGGKSLKEHLEATNHASALNWIYSLIHENLSSITENVILKIHQLILKGIDDDNAGCYRRVPVRIAGSAVILPNARKVPQLMEQFIKLLQNNDIHPVHLAAELHYELVTIHPFTDGNGRTARLLMNLILLMHGYPAAIIRKQDRLAYINSLEKAQLGGSKEEYFMLIAKAVDRSLDIYLKAIKQKENDHEESLHLIRIGALAQAAQETVATIRFWTKEGLLEVADSTPSGYQLYHSNMIERIKIIKRFKTQRYTLNEIKNTLVDY